MKKEKKIIPAKKSKIVVTARKGPAKKIAKSISVKKTKVPAKKVTKVAAVKKTQSPAKKATKKATSKEILSPVTSETKSIVKKETPVIPPSVPEIITHGEDLHLIPAQDGIHPITAFEVHQKENIFHHREEVAFRQENQKVKAAMPSRKNKKITYRMKGRI